MLLPILNCDNCGVCCMEQESPPGYLAMLTVPGYPASDADMKRLAGMSDALLTELLEYLEYIREHKTHPNNGICIWFDEVTKRCKHYDLRPDTCREVVECGDENCRGWRDAYGVDIEPIVGPNIPKTLPLQEEQ